MNNESDFMSMIAEEIGNACAAEIINISNLDEKRLQEYVLKIPEICKTKESEVGNGSEFDLFTASILVIRKIVADTFVAVAGMNENPIVKEKVENRIVASIINKLFDRAMNLTIVPVNQSDHGTKH